jgi:hypothetical protein
VNGEQKVLFREVQRFGQLWLWLLVVVAVVGTVAAVWPVLQEESGLSFWSVVGASTGLGITVAMLFLFVVLKLTTEVRTDGLFVRFFPLHLSWRTIDLTDVTSCHAVTYRPIGEYGGWGIRRSWHWDGWAYNVSGNRGVRLDYADGHHLLIGSQRPEELADAIQSLLARSH